VTVNVAAKWLQCLELLRVGTRRLISIPGRSRALNRQPRPALLESSSALRR